MEEEEEEVVESEEVAEQVTCPSPVRPQPNPCVPDRLAVTQAAVGALPATLGSLSYLRPRLGGGEQPARIRVYTKSAANSAVMKLTLAAGSGELSRCRWMKASRSSPF